MPKKNYKYECIVQYPDGREVNIKDLPQEERERLAQHWGQRMANTLADYYAEHPEAFVG